MNVLKRKIQKTALFTPDEKAEILGAFDTFPDSDIRELESIIDAYDAKYVKILATFRQNMSEELDTIQAKTPPEKVSQMRKAIAQIRNGLNVVTTP